MKQRARWLAGALAVLLCLIGMAQAEEIQDDQVTLPPVDDTLLFTDPLELLVAQNDARRFSDAHWGDATKQANICTVNIWGVVETDTELAICAEIYEVSFALYGQELASESGSVIPTRLRFARGAAGEWQLRDCREPEDGERNWQSWLALVAEVPGMAEAIAQRGTMSPRMGENQAPAAAGWQPGEGREFIDHEDALLEDGAVPPTGLEDGQWTPEMLEKIHNSMHYDGEKGWQRINQIATYLRVNNLTGVYIRGYYYTYDEETGALHLRPFHIPLS